MRRDNYKSYVGWAYKEYKQNVTVVLWKYCFSIREFGMESF